jgi:urea transport system substrate-binding protein
LTAAPLRAQTALPPVTLGAGVQTSFVHNMPDGEDSTDSFLLNSARLYVNGPVTDKIKFMFNTEFDGATNKIGVLDAVARFEMNPKFNVWAGRFIAPSDRANLYGPYYSHEWAVTPTASRTVSLRGHRSLQRRRVLGRLWQGQGVAGGFDGTSTNGNPDIIGAARVQVDLWDKEGGYYLNGTYYGAKDLLSIGARGAGAVREQGRQRRPPHGEEARRRRRGHHRERIRQLRQFRRLRLALRQQRRGVRAGGYLFPKPRGLASSKCSPSTRKRISARACRRLTRLRPENHRSQPELHHQGIQREDHDLLQEHRFQRREDGLQASRRWPADPNVRRLSLGSFNLVHEKECIHETQTGMACHGTLRPGAGILERRSAQDTIKVGILHSLSGTMAISETTLKDTVLMMIDAQNKKGGLLGKKLEAVVVDPASNWPLFAEKAAQLLEKDKVAWSFGAGRPCPEIRAAGVREGQRLLFYPVQYEGEESSKNVIYTGRAPNQQAIPAVDYLMKDVAVKRWVLEGTDYVYPRTTNKILEAYLLSKGVAAADISINYTPFGHSDWQARVAAIKRFGSAGKKTAVVSTINGDANVPFYKELGNQKISAEDIPVVAFSVGEEELSGLDTKPLVGHLAAWNYFQSINNPANKAFIDQWKAFIKNPKRTTNDPMEAHYIGFNLWVKAVQKAASTDVTKVLAALPGLETPNLTGGIAKMLPNHHITKPVYIGEVRADGMFDVVWKTPGTVPGDAWSDFLPASKIIEADWVTLKCGNYNTQTKTCSGQNYK